ncbi:MAG: hypothetical protein KAT12_00740 [Gammaproteobacteria bacterium]|nr:hypothetical protein [Gammaproteobacteria bacterium]
MNAQWNIERDRASIDKRSPALCSPEHLCSWWLTQSKFDEVFDDQQCFSPLINTGWMERISTPSVKDSYSKGALLETLSKNGWRLPLHLQLYNPGYIRDRGFLVDDK